MIYLFQRQSFFNCFLDDVHRKLKLLKVSKAKAQGAAQVASELRLTVRPKGNPIPRGRMRRGK